MNLEIKYMNKDKWNRVKSREYVYMPCKYGDLYGEAGLIYIREVIEPLYKSYNGINIKLLDSGYYWLQIGLEGKKYWITAMYNQNKEIIQYYIDITDKNVILKDGKSYFYDLFLDIVQLNTGEVFLLDEDELLQALNDKIIDKIQYDFAYKEANEIINEINMKNLKIKELCNIYLEKLIKKLNLRGI